jgi:hypothetical protein
MRPLVLTACLLTSLVFVACPGDPPIETGDPDTDTEVDTSDPDTDDPDTDTELNGTDEDRDGWTIENGDCDDTDVFVNPAWEERANDDKDNDCDGRIDESLDRFMVFEVRPGDDPPLARLRSVNVLGDISNATPLSNMVSATTPVEVTGEDRWLVLDERSGTLNSVTAAGDSTVVTDFLEDEEWPGPRDPLGFFGTGRTRDGVVYITTANQLIAVQPDGEWDIVADWPCNDEVEGTEICPVALTVRATDEAVGLFGAFGSFALWTAEDGLDIRIPTAVNPMAPPAEWNAARSDEQGRLYALGTVFDADTRAQTRGIFRYNDAQGAMVLRGPWLDSNGAGPGGFTNEWRFGSFDIDTVRGEYYVGANIGSGGTTRRTVYRVFDGEDGIAALLWPETFAGNADGTGLEFSALAIRWNQD